MPDSPKKRAAAPTPAPAATVGGVGISPPAAASASDAPTSHTAAAASAALPTGEPPVPLPATAAATSRVASPAASTTSAPAATASAALPTGEPPVPLPAAASPAAAALAGRRVVLTRPEGEASAALRAALETLGATVLEIPLLEVEYTADTTALQDAWTDMGRFDWIIFTSANGVRGFFDRFFETFNDIRAIGLARIASVGDATAAAIRALHLNVDFQPETSTAAALAGELSQREDLAHLRVLVVTGDRNSDELPKILERTAKAIVQTLAVYAVTENDAGQLDATESFRRKGADAILFASPSAVDSFVAQARRLVPAKTARQPRAIAIGPATADALREHGIPVAAVSPAPTPHVFAQTVARLLAETGKPAAAAAPAQSKASILLVSPASAATKDKQDACPTSRATGGSPVRGDAVAAAAAAERAGRPRSIDAAAAAASSATSPTTTPPPTAR